MKPPIRVMLLTAVAALIACDSNQGSRPASSAPSATAGPATVAATPAVIEHVENPLTDAGTYIIDLSPGRISIRARQVGERELLESLAVMAGFQLLAGDLAWKVVTVDVQADTLHAALTELLRAYPYQLVYTSDRETQREVLSEVVVGEEPFPEALEGDARAATDDEILPEEIDEQFDRQQAYLQDLQSPVVEVRETAVGEIDPVGNALYALTDTLANDPSPEVRRAAIDALESSDDPLAIQALVICLEDGDIDVVIECITSLEYIGNEGSIVHLQPLLMHYDEAVRYAAESAIESLQ